MTHFLFCYIPFFFFLLCKNIVHWVCESQWARLCCLMEISKTLGTRAHANSAVYPKAFPGSFQVRTQESSIFGSMSSTCGFVVSIAGEKSMGPKSPLK